MHILKKLTLVRQADKEMEEGKAEEMISELQLLAPFLSFWKSPKLLLMWACTAGADHQGSSWLLQHPSCPKVGQPWAQMAAWCPQRIWQRHNVKFSQSSPALYSRMSWEHPTPWKPLPSPHCKFWGWYYSNRVRKASEHGRDEGGKHIIWRNLPVQTHTSFTLLCFADISP